MRIRKIQLLKFKRFTDLTIDLGSEPKKIIALTGSNGCGKSSIFDALEEISKNYRGGGAGFQFGKIYEGNSEKCNRDQHIKIETYSGNAFKQNSIYIRSAYRFTPSINATQIKALPTIKKMSLFRL